MRVKDFRNRDWGLRWRVQGQGMRDTGFGLRAEGLGCRVQGAGGRVQGLGSKALGGDIASCPFHQPSQGPLSREYGRVRLIDSCITQLKA